jgi:hypothetical protein
MTCPGLAGFDIQRHSFGQELRWDQSPGEAESRVSHAKVINFIHTVSAAISDNREERRNLCELGRIREGPVSRGLPWTQTGSSTTTGIRRLVAAW